MQPSLTVVLTASPNPFGPCDFVPHYEKKFKVEGYHFDNVEEIQQPFESDQNGTSSWTKAF